jgi:hypothetical protein
MSKRRIRQRPEDLPQYQNRKGPDGEDLDSTEALSWFPELDCAASPLDPVVGGTVRVAYAGMHFWLSDVRASVEPGTFFGNVEWPEGIPAYDEGYAHLGPDQQIGFEPKHVFDIVRVAS